MKLFKSLVLCLLIFLPAQSSMAALPAKVFAPYVDVMLYPTFSLTNCYNSTGQKYYTLAFIIAGYDNTPMWGGSIAVSANHMLSDITSLRAAGGDVIVSFGGANGTPIDAVYTDINALVAAYSSVIDKYGLTWIDFDIEGWWVQDAASIDRRNQAAKLLQSKYPGLRITYCLPVMPTGLTADGINIINKAKAAGVNIYGVNVMAMDYGSPNSAMGQAAISAAQNTRSQTGLNIGITPMIGQNDTQGEIFTLSNATEVLNFAKANSYVNMIAMWSANRDNGGCPGQTYASPTCSGVSQSTFAYINAFKSYSGGGGNIYPTVSLTSPANGANFTTGSTITFSANASDADGSVTSVQFFRGTTSIGTDNTSPYSVSWANATAGTYSITAVATDNAGAKTTSAAITITVGTTTNKPPVVSLTAPANNSSFASGANITFSATASDPDGTVSQVQFFRGTTSIGTDNTSPYSVTWTGATSGTYTITAVATDNAGAKTTSAAITITVTGGTGGCTGIAAYSPTKIYNAGDQVVYNNKLYKALVSGIANVPPDYCPACGWWQLIGDCSTLKSSDEMSAPSVVSSFSLSSYPNPVAENATISFAILKTGYVRLSVYSLNGKEISVITDGTLKAGIYYNTWNTSKVAAGAYMLRLSTADGSKTQKIMVVK